MNYLEVLNVSYNTRMIQQAEDLRLPHTFLDIRVSHANKGNSLNHNLRRRIRSNLSYKRGSI